MRRYLALFLPFLPTERWRSRRPAARRMTKRLSRWSKSRTMRKDFTRSIPPPWIRGLRPVCLWRTRAPVCRIFDVAEADRPADRELLLAPGGALRALYAADGAWTSRMASSLTSPAAPICSAARRVFSPARSRSLASLDFPPGPRWRRTPDCARALARFSEGGVFLPARRRRRSRACRSPRWRWMRTRLLALRRAGLKTHRRSGRAVLARFRRAFRRRFLRAKSNGCWAARIVRITPLRPPPDCMVERHFVEPLTQAESIEAVLRDLMLEAETLLERRGQGGRRFEASFFRADGVVRRLAVETLRPTRDPKILAGCFAKSSIRWPIRSIPVSVSTLCVWPCRARKISDLRKATLSAPAAREAERELSELLDRLTTRFGRARVLRFMQGDTYEPERESRAAPVAARGCPQTWSKPPEGEPPARPLTLFDPPQPVEVLALAPDGPPARFRWRRKMHDVLRAEGPERIAPDWAVLGDGGSPTRDYYRVEDVEGRRFWLFRRGLYEAGDDSRAGFCMGCSHDPLCRTGLRQPLFLPARRLAAGGIDRRGVAHELRRPWPVRPQFRRRRRARPFRAGRFFAR